MRKYTIIDTTITESVKHPAHVLAMEIVERLEYDRLSDDTVNLEVEFTLDGVNYHFDLIVYTSCKVWPASYLQPEEYELYVDRIHICLAHAGEEPFTSKEQARLETAIYAATPFKVD